MINFWFNECNCCLIKQSKEAEPQEGQFLNTHEAPDGMRIPFCGSHYMV